MDYQEILRWIINHLWVEVAIVVFFVASVYLAFQKQNVVELKPLRLPNPERVPPAPESQAELELIDLGFRWIGDFDASSVEGVVTLTRFYSSKDGLHQGMIVDVESQDYQTSMVEFNSELSPQGNISTNNNRQPGVYSYRLEMLVVRAPWKRIVRELFTLHQALCGAATQCGFRPRLLHAKDLCFQVSNDSRQDLEGECARGRLHPISANSYQTTFLGALRYTPRIWFKMVHGHLLIWYRPADQTLAARARRRFARAAREVGMTR
jgi:hypothetical protein